MLRNSNAHPADRPLVVVFLSSNSLSSCSPPLSLHSRASSDTLLRPRSLNCMPATPVGLVTASHALHVVYLRAADRPASSMQVPVTRTLPNSEQTSTRLNKSEDATTDRDGEGFAFCSQRVDDEPTPRYFFFDRRAPGASAVHGHSGRRSRCPCQVRIDRGES